MTTLFFTSAIRDIDVVIDSKHTHDVKFSTDIVLNRIVYIAKRAIDSDSMLPRWENLHMQ